MVSAFQGKYYPIHSLPRCVWTVWIRVCGEWLTCEASIISTDHGKSHLQHLAMGGKPYHAQSLYGQLSLHIGCATTSQCVWSTERGHVPFLGCERLKMWLHAWAKCHGRCWWALGSSDRERESADHMTNCAGMQKRMWTEAREKEGFKDFI